MYKRQFVAGVQLSANDMLRIGDWIALPGGVANGVVEEITLNTVKKRNWDETRQLSPSHVTKRSVLEGKANYPIKG